MKRLGLSMGWQNSTNSLKCSVIQGIHDLITWHKD